MRGCNLLVTKKNKEPGLNQAHLLMLLILEFIYCTGTTLGFERGSFILTLPLRTFWI